jgi:hypothetical protein
MTSIFFALALIGGALALGGYGWSVAKDLRARKEEAIAAEEAQGEPHDSAGPGTLSAPPDIGPAGGNPARMHSAFSFVGVGRRVRREGLRETLPSLLVAAGLLAVLIFGALALFTSLPSKLFGVAALAVAFYVSVTELRAFGKALRGEER